MKKILAIMVAGMSVMCCTPKASECPVYLDEEASLDARVQDALGRMTVEEKVAIIHAQSKFSSAGVPRLGIPELWCTDGPHGVRAEVLWDEWNQAGWTNDSVVAFPALTCLAATWDREMAALYGQSIGEEALYRGKDVLLGPGVNIYRTPLNGRNFEYMGEDPFLSGEMVVPYVQNVQKQGVATCVKHFCLNNEETFRHSIDVDLDDRALYEIYLPAFKKAVVDGGTWSIMGSYNIYRGQHVCHNSRILCDILKGEWGFDGAVISDWGGVHDTDEAIKNGMDLEFGTWTDGLTMGKTNSYDAYFLADPYLKKIRSGEVGTEELDDKAGRVLRLIFRTAMKSGKAQGSLCSESHYEAARKIADEGIVLLKNDNAVLPVGADAKNILVVGENAVKMLTVGGGSSSLKAQKEISPLTGITERAAENGAAVTYERGYVGAGATYQDGIASKDNLDESRSPEQLLADAVAKAREADLVVFVGGLNKDGHQDCEGADRLGLELPYNQDSIIDALAQANSNLVVVLLSGNAVTMPWLDKVPALVQGWYPGSICGQAIADILFGDVNPSGRLPFTFPAQLSDSPAHSDGQSIPNNGPTYYKEGIFVGYRWFDTKGIKPLFPFGYGLSYTKFEYGEASLSAKSIKSVQSEVEAGLDAEKNARDSKSITVSVPVTNVGERAGYEVVQLYIADHESSLPRPAKELKGFEKVWLEPGETKTVKFAIDEDMLRFFDAEKHAWVSEKGEFSVIIAANAEDTRSIVNFSLK